MSTTGSAIDWDGPELVFERSVRSERFVICHSSRSFSGRFWRGTDHSDHRRPLVLIQHGGGMHPTAATVLNVVQPLISDLGVSVAAIDGPIHGARNTLELDVPQLRDSFLRHWRDTDSVPKMVADWNCTLNLLLQRPDVDRSAIGWWGVSMGTAYGMPFLANRTGFKAAVLGKWSLDYPNSDVLGRAAESIRCPTLFFMQWHDEYFSRNGAFELFDRIAATDKRMHVFPGSHSSAAAEHISDSIVFFRKYLIPPQT